MWLSYWFNSMTTGHLYRVEGPVLLLFWSHACSSSPVVLLLLLGLATTTAFSHCSIMITSVAKSSSKECQELKTTTSIVVVTTTKCLSSMHLDMRLLFYDCYVVPLYRIHSHSALATCLVTPIRPKSHRYQLGQNKNCMNQRTSGPQRVTFLIACVNKAMTRCLHATQWLLAW